LIKIKVISSRTIWSRTRTRTRRTIWYLSLWNSEYSKWYVHFDRLDKLFAMVHSNSSLEIILYGEILNILQNKWEHQHSWNSLVSNPTTMHYISILIKLGNSWWSKIDNKGHQQVLPSLPFASPLANYYDGSGVATMLSHLKSTHAFKQKFFSGLESIILTFKLTHITFNYGTFLPSLGSWVIERQNDQVKHYVSSLHQPLFWSFARFSK
jgi:hypothetical protein